MNLFKCKWEEHAPGRETMPDKHIIKMKPKQLKRKDFK